MTDTIWFVRQRCQQLVVNTDSDGYSIHCVDQELQSNQGYTLLQNIKVCGSLYWVACGKQWTFRKARATWHNDMLLPGQCKQAACPEVKDSKALQGGRSICNVLTRRIMQGCVYTVSYRLVLPLSNKMHSVS